MDKGLQALATAIIMQAYYDIRRLNRKKINYFQSHNDMYNRCELKQFANSDWLDVLCDIVEIETSSVQRKLNSLIREEK